MKAKKVVTVSKTIDQYYREHVRPFKAALKKAAKTSPKAKKLLPQLQKFESAFIVRFFGKKTG